MKKLSSKITLLASVLAVACMFTVPAVRAADEATKAEKKAKRDADNLKKYDANKDGKLDEKETAAMKADQDKMKAEKDAKKKAADEKK
ncbi:MAG: hypothetical protein EXS32_00730 [Opitutus sp.]|nr:hypothetical protein [Opitutus sp.]